MKHEELYLFDTEKRAKAPVLCGVDEAGRGPLAGPVACAAVILPPDIRLEGVNDSKKLTEKRREEIYEAIVQQAVCFKVELIGPEVIDEINILNATMLGMRRAIEGLCVKPDLALIDGNRCPSGLTVSAEAVIKGDALSASIAAASILAKVTRDRYMRKLAEEYPQYGFEKHKGYGTRLHYDMIKAYGVQPFHRRSFLKKLGY